MAGKSESVLDESNSCGEGGVTPQGTSTVSVTSESIAAHASLTTVKSLEASSERFSVSGSSLKARQHTKQQDTKTKVIASDEADRNEAVFTNRGSLLRR